jgi:HAMP domain-containing protein
MMTASADGKKPPKGAKRAQSKTLYQITALLVVLLLASGLTIFFLVANAQKNQLQESKNKLIDVEARGVAASFDLISQVYAQQAIDIGLKLGPIGAAKGLMNQQISETQDYINKVFAEKVGSGTLGMDYIMFIQVSAPMFSQPILFASSDPTLIYHWQVPGYLVDAIDRGDTYLYLDNGIPELGLEAEQLITIKLMEYPEWGYRGAVIGIKPMHDDIAAINDFYNKGRNRLGLILGLSVLISVLGVILISFFILNYLLRKRITEPIEELTAVAGKVMDGSLDVEVEEHPGSDFHLLEQAFKEMLASLQKLFDKATS